MARNDGKYLEEEVERLLEKNTDSNRHWRRLPDARAARGLIPAQPADYFLSWVYGFGGEEWPTPNHLECKSVKGKTRRLPKFKQHAEMLRWANAGVDGYVLVHFWEINEFAIVDVEDLKIGKPSWVITSEFNSVKECLNQMGWKV